MDNRINKMDILVVSLPLEKMKVNWDDYSQCMETYKMFQTTNHIYIYISNIYIYAYTLESTEHVI